MNPNQDEFSREPMAVAPDPERDSTRGREELPGRPRWVKAFGIATLTLVVLFVIIHLAGGGMGHH